LPGYTHSSEEFRTIELVTPARWEIVCGSDQEGYLDFAEREILPHVASLG
jgi:hypothetical protein